MPDASVDATGAGVADWAGLLDGFEHPVKIPTPMAVPKKKRQKDVETRRTVNPFIRVRLANGRNPMKRSCTAQLLIALLFSALMVGCASTPPPPAPPDESALSSAGFKVVVAKTPQQQEHLRTLTPGQLTAMERNGTPFFVYPDVAKNQIYVGTQKEYEAYRRLRPDAGPTPQDKVNAQHAADMASYLKQDAAMQKETARDLSDPYYFWPSFFELVW
jgi:hypothetical protein